jgi:uncharacterized protein YbjT (DUF2867 family)
MILVSGATGRIGSVLVKLLLAKGAQIRAIVHSGDKAAALPSVVETVAGDFTKPESLRPALDGVDHAFLLTPPVEQAAEWQSNFVRVAKEAGVAHVVKLSILGADPFSNSRFQRSHGEGEKALEESEMGWTHLRANFFMQTALQYLKDDALYSLAGEGRISVVDLRDVAAVATVVLTAPGHEGRVYEITGPEALTHAEMAERLSKALHRKITVTNLDFEQARAMMAGGGFAAWNIDGILELQRWFQSGAAAGVTDVVGRVWTREARLFGKFVEEYGLSTGRKAG